MKKIYTIIILIILILAATLIYINNTPEETTATDDSIASTTTTVNIATTTEQPGVVVKDFEGEANPDMMKLDMKTWSWISTIYNDGTTIKPKQVDKFKMTFNVKNKSFSVATDCNGIGGEYILNEKNITFDKMMSTLMYYEGSQESDFSRTLSQVSGYHFTSKGELVFDLKYDSGSMIFR